MPNLLRSRPSWVAGLLLLVHALALITFGARPPGVLLSNTIQFVLGCVALAAVFLAGRRSGPLGHRVWLLVSLALAIWIVAQGIIIYYDGVLHASYLTRWPSDPLIFFWVVPLFMAVFLGSAPGQKAFDVVQLLDFAQIMILGVTAYLAFLYLPSAWQAAGQWMAKLGWDATNVRDALLTGGLAARALFSQSKLVRSLFLRLTIFFLLYQFADLVYHYVEEVWKVATGSPWDLLWSVPFAGLIVVAATWEERDEAALGDHQATPRAVSRPLFLSSAFLPLLVLLVAVKLQKETPGLGAALVIASLLCSETRLLLTQRRRDQSELLQSALYRIAAKASSSHNTRELCGEIHAILGELMYARNFYVALRDKSAQTLSFVYFQDEADSFPSGPVPLGRGLTEYVLRTGEPLLAGPERFQEMLGRGEVEDLGAPSVDWLGVPLKKSDETLGVLVVQSYDEKQRYSEKDKEVLTFVAQHLTNFVEQKRNEETLRSSEARYRSLFERNMAGVFRSTREGRMLDCNEAFAKMLGYAREELFRLPTSVLYFGGQAEREERLAAFKKTQQFTNYEIQFCRKDGGPLWAIQNVSLVKDEHGHEIIEGTVVDITERKLAEKEITRWERRYDAAVQASRQVLYEWDPFSNRANFGGLLEEVLGYSPEEFAEQARVWRELVHPEDLAQYVESMNRAIGSVSAFDIEYRLRHKNGAFRMLRDQGRVVVDPEADGKIMVGFITDVTEFRLLEQQFRQSQKMEAVGRLAGGIAHDFNNLLTVITGYTDLQLQSSEPSEPVYQQAQQIAEATARAASLTKQLLAFSRQQVLQPRTIDLNAILDRLDSMFRRLIGEDVEVSTILAPGLGSVEVDPVQIEQVLLNLVINARDAMPDGGTLTIETENVELDETYVSGHASGPAGRYVRIAVSDTGVGMDSDTRARLFEPFFTTKEVGRGTGLGLSTAYGIIKQSGGQIEVYSEPGRGSTFKIYLPRVDRPAVSPPMQARTIPQSRGTEKILLVEDDEQVRKLTEAVLVDRGYTVLAAADVEQVDQICSRHDGIELLLTDVVMPRVSGKEIARRVTARYPGIKTIFMSGYTPNAVVHHGVLDEGIFFLQKPFSPSELAAKIREVLDSSST